MRKITWIDVGGWARKIRWREREEKVRLIKIIGSQDWELKGIVIIRCDNGGSDLGARTSIHTRRGYKMYKRGLN